MHRGLLQWPKTGVIYAANEVYVWASFTGSRGGNLEKRPQAYGGHTCLWAVWQLGETVQTLTVWWYAGRHQAEGLLHRTSIALSLARGLSQSDRLFASVHKNLAWMPIFKVEFASAMGIMRRARYVSQSPQAQHNRNRGRELKPEIRTGRPEV